MRDPFYVSGPAVISFSGGRTSAYMLRRILDAHHGALPDDVIVTFANTGREMPATLDFVAECGSRWNVRVRWLEYCRDASGPSFIEVSHNSASRSGEPLEALFKSKPMLPNPVTRFCTIEAKIRTIKRFVRSVLRWDHWVSVVGLRSDEPVRVARALDREKTKKDRWHNLCPLAEAGIQEVDVLRFWRGQAFDLMLKGRWEGNCDGCFLKNRGAISRMCLDYPERMQWWSKMEQLPHGKGAGGTFRADRENYATILETTKRQGVIPFDLEDPAVPCDGGCGV